MIAIDTNVLVRLLVPDDAPQTGRARDAVAQAESAGEPILVNDVVLAETLWTMARRYKASRSELLDVATGLLNTGVFEFEQRGDIEAAVHLFEHSSADFSDCLIIAKNKSAGCGLTLTFDVDCQKLPSAAAL